MMKFMEFVYVASNHEEGHVGLEAIRAACDKPSNGLEFGNVKEIFNFADGTVVLQFTARYRTKLGRGSAWNVIDMLNKRLRHEGIDAYVVYPKARLAA